MNVEEIAWELGDIEEALIALDHHTSMGNKIASSFSESLKIRQEKLLAEVEKYGFQNQVNSLMANRYQ